MCYENTIKRLLSLEEIACDVEVTEEILFRAKITVHTPDLNDGSPERIIELKEFELIRVNCTYLLHQTGKYVPKKSSGDDSIIILRRTGRLHSFRLSYSTQEGSYSRLYKPDN